MLGPRSPVPLSVLEAFGADGAPVQLAGGQGDVVRAGGIVLKPVGSESEAQLTGRLFEQLEGPGFRVPRPVRARTGSFVADGWTAWQYVDAEPAGPNGGRWPETFAACRAFHAALSSLDGTAWRDVFARRTDPWAEADRLAFGEAAAEPLSDFAPLIRRFSGHIRPLEVPSQLLHGDFTANVLFAEGEPPCVIDFSPYWRPAEFALGVVAADAIAWAGTDGSLLALMDCADAEQWALRGMLRRVWECERHTVRGRDLRPHLVEYERAADALGF